MKTALITGITGQDGSFLAELLLKKNYQVHGLIRRSAELNTFRIENIFGHKRLKLHYGDLTDSICLNQIITNVNPDEIYNLAAQSHVKISFEIPEITATIDALGTLKLLELVKSSSKKIKLYQASTSELYGKVLEQKKQNEQTPFYPRSPYGVAKLYGYWIIKNYREAYNLFACNGILFNHESERRGFNFVSRKITIGLCRIKLGYQKILEMGNLDAKRDWGYAKEYVEAMHLMLQQKKPKDYVIATGEVNTVRRFIELTALELGMEIIWRGEGLKEVGVDKKTKKTIIKINPKYFRPTEVDFLLGDASLAKKELKWQAKTKLNDLVKIMVKSDYESLKKNQGRFFY